MNTAEHMTFAYPAAWCSNGSPGTGTYFVGSSKELARAMSLRREVSRFVSWANRGTVMMTSATIDDRSFIIPFRPRSAPERSRLQSCRLRKEFLEHGVFQNM